MSAGYECLVHREFDVLRNLLQRVQAELWRSTWVRSSSGALFKYLHWWHDGDAGCGRCRRERRVIKEALPSLEHGVAHFHKCTRVVQRDIDCPLGKFRHVAGPN